MSARASSMQHARATTLGDHMCAAQKHSVQHCAAMRPATRQQNVTCNVCAAMQPAMLARGGASRDSRRTSSEARNASAPQAPPRAGQAPSASAD
eukprot:3370128-Alexandrium_andersonii.AAC.1